MDKLPTHIAYSDESYYTASRYRSVAVVTLNVPQDQKVSQVIRRLLDDSKVKEFKWGKLRQARERFAALKMIDKAVELSIQGQLRVDVLVWDTYDARHSLSGRDDVANLQRMYYHLFKNVLQCRWPTGATWQLCPDENSALEWNTVHDFLSAAGSNRRVECGLFDKGGFRLRLEREFNIFDILEVCSADMPICQLSDLFAGLGVYSHASYDKYQCWLQSQSSQMVLDLGLPKIQQKFSNRDHERFVVMNYLDERCKQSKLRVGLRSSRGFRTYDPRFPINFWMYEPQHPDDKAPIKGKM